MFDRGYKFAPYKITINPIKLLLRSWFAEILILKKQPAAIIAEWIMEVILVIMNALLIMRTCGNCPELNTLPEKGGQHLPGENHH